jgi:RNA polymerase sigma factor (sigma-70 family)
MRAMTTTGTHVFDASLSDPMPQITEFDRLMADVAAGSDDAVWQLAETYTPYIIRAVRHNLSPKLRQKLDSQDFAQTLWASLLLRPTDLSGLKTPQQLIAYLAGATRNKVFEKARRFKAQKCDIRREESLDQPRRTEKSLRADTNEGLYSPDPSPSTTASVREHWCHILGKASERDRKIVQLRRAGWTFEAISEELHIDEKTARRAMHRLLEQFAN